MTVGDRDFHSFLFHDLILAIAILQFRVSLFIETQGMREGISRSEFWILKLDIRQA